MHVVMHELVRVGGGRTGVPGLKKKPMALYSIVVVMQEWVRVGGGGAGILSLPHSDLI